MLILSSSGFKIPAIIDPVSGCNPESGIPAGYRMPPDASSIPDSGIPAIIIFRIPAEF